MSSLAIACRLASGGINYIHTDHLGAPQKMTNPGQTIVWDAVSDPFMAGQLPTNPQMYLRFPGQYFDAETALHQNGMRDYDPSIGRYIESDPIGLAGGINTYAYVGSNPVSRIDPLGEDWLECFDKCLRQYDYLGIMGDSSLTAAGGTFPKSWVGQPSGLGGASRLTTIPSSVAYAAGGGAAGTFGGFFRALGRYASPLWIAYGDYLFVIEAYCAARCIGSDCGP